LTPNTSAANIIVIGMQGMWSAFFPARTARILSRPVIAHTFLPETALQLNL
jgi:hypothetical protein